MIHYPGQLVSAATERFGTLTGKKPDLIPTGMKPLDEKIGGLTPQMVGLLAIARGVGKSSTALVAGYASTAKAGILSLEDPPEELGLRLLSLKTGINGLRIRLNRIDAEERKLVKQAREALAEEDGLVFSFRIGGNLKAVEEGIDELGEAGCRLMYVDYAQKVTGHNREQRNIEVANTYSAMASRIAHWNAAGIVLSQITDPDPRRKSRRPRMTDVRDSRDLINEARIVIMGWRDDTDERLVHYSLDKSMVGGDGLHWQMRRDASGTLRELREEDDFEGDY